MSDTLQTRPQAETPRLVKIAFLALAAACVIALLFAKGYDAFVVQKRQVESAMQVQRLEGVPAPFTLKDRAGAAVSLSELKGKVVFLNFWATWCGPCREEMPSMAQLAAQFDPADTAFVFVSVDESWQPVDEFLGPAPKAFRVLLDAEKTVSTAYGTTMFPETYVIGKDGRLLYKAVGGRDWGLVAARKLLERAGATRITGPARG